MKMKPEFQTKPMLTSADGRLLSCWLSPGYVAARGGEAPLEGQYAHEHDMLRRICAVQESSRKMALPVAAWKLESSETDGMIRYVITGYDAEAEEVWEIDVECARRGEQTMKMRPMIPKDGFSARKRAEAKELADWLCGAAALVFAGALAGYALALVVMMNA